MRYILLIVSLAFLNVSCAKEGPSHCEYEQGYVPHKKIKDKNVSFYKWEDRKDKESDEYITSLYLIYKNGNVATIQHKYCAMYNFEVDYLVADPKFPLKKANIGKLMAQYFTLYSVKKIKFTPSLDKVLGSDLEDYKYSGNENIEISLDHYPLTSAGTYRQVESFYIGIGGE